MFCFCIEDVDVDKPDERSLITYVSSMYDALPKVPPYPISITVEVSSIHIILINISVL